MQCLCSYVERWSFNTEFEIFVFLSIIQSLNLSDENGAFIK